MQVSVFGRSQSYVSPAGRYVGGLMAVALLCVAAQFMASLGYYVYAAICARSWPHTQATILDFQLGEGVNEGEESPPFLSLEYQFTVDGQTLRANRLTLAGSPSYLKSLLEPRVREWELAFQDQQTVTCFYDPGEPTNAVLDRRLLAIVVWWRLLGAGGSLFACIFLLYIVTDAIRRRHRLSVVAKKYPKEPWKARADWAAGIVKSASRYDSYILVSLALSYVCVFLPLLLWIIHQGGGQIFSWSGGIALFLGWGAINLTRMRLVSHTYDRAQFRMGEVPGVIGGPIFGSVHLPKKWTSQRNIRVALECLQIELINQDSAENHAFVENVLHREIRTLHSTLQSDDENECVVPVYFAIPYDSQPSKPDDNPSIHWLLKVGPEGGEGLAEFAQFDVPVFKTELSSPEFEPNAEVMKQFEVPLLLSDVLQRSGVRERALDGQSRLISISAFSPKLLWLSLGAGLIPGAASVLLVALGHAYWAILPALLFLGLAAAASFKLLWRCRLQITPEAVIARAGFPFFWDTTMVVSHRDVSGWKHDVESAMQQRSYYRVRIWLKVPFDETEDAPDKEAPEDTHATQPHMQDREADFIIRELTVARDLASPLEAKMLIEWLSTRTGIPTGDPPPRP